MGLMAFTGMVGSVGELPEEFWNQKPKKIKDKYSGTISYEVGWDLHCSFGPAVLYKDGSGEYYIEGSQLKPKEVKLFKEILVNIKLAPLYINHPVLKYPAKWKLKNTAV